MSQLFALLAPQHTSPSRLAPGARHALCPYPSRQATRLNTWRHTAWRGAACVRAADHSVPGGPGVLPRDPRAGGVAAGRAPGGHRAGRHRRGLRAGRLRRRAGCACADRRARGACCGARGAEACLCHMCQSTNALELSWYHRCEQGLQQHMRSAAPDPSLRQLMAPFEGGATIRRHETCAAGGTSTPQSGFAAGNCHKSDWLHAELQSEL